ncbi:MAG: S-4TM family putative pore-forming effector [Ignavibacteriaceae bacterium]
MHPLIAKQNHPDFIKLLKASSVAYSDAKLLENTVTVILLFLAFAYPISYIYIKNDSINFVLFSISIFITIFVLAFDILHESSTLKGALIKEEFDTSLFELRWKSTLKKIDHAEISGLAIKYDGAEIKDWYSPDILAKIKKITVISICQRINTGWDIHLRKNYNLFLSWFLFIYTLLLISVILLVNANNQTIFFIAFSLLSFYSHFITIIRGHSKVIKKRESINAILDPIIFNKKDVTIEELRDIQDEIFQTRQENSKVPNFYFKHQREKLNKQFDDFISDVNNKYK